MQENYHVENSLLLPLRFRETIAIIDNSHLYIVVIIEQICYNWWYSLKTRPLRRMNELEITQ